MAARDKNHFKIGLFLLITLFFLCSGIVLFGAGVIFKPNTVDFESYFDTSVEGLQKGSPLKFRGVKVGDVAKIDFASNFYEAQASRPVNLVLVRCRVNLELIPKALKGTLSTSEETRKEVFELLVERGMRVRLTTSGIAGIPYLELDYHKPEDFPLEPLDWEPQTNYIPAIPGFASRLSESLEISFDRLSKVPFDSIGEDLDKLLIALTDGVSDLEIEAVTHEAKALLSELRMTNDSFRKWIENPAMQKLPDDVAGLVADTDRLVTNAEKPLNELLASVAHAGEKIDSLATALESKLPAASDEARLALLRARRLIQQIEERADRLLADLNVVAGNLKSVTEGARDNPSRTLFGAPPPHRED